MELLRIVAMLLVMVVHADFRALSVPTVAEFDSDTVRTVMRLVFESLSIISVNTFVLLSGWFGIHFKFSRFAEFLFQVAFFLLFCFCITTFIDPSQTLNIKGFSRLLLLGEWDYWFVKCYLLMYIFAPVMNSFVEHSSERQLRTFLILFYAFQTVYGLVGGAEWFRLGYSGLSFMGLYLLARYLRLYPNRLTSMPRRCDMLVYLGGALIMTLIGILVLATGNNPKLINRMYVYTSPLVIVSAVYFLLYFSKFKVTYNKTINWVASSCFAIYLVHSNPWFSDPFYNEPFRFLFQNYRGFGFFARAALFIAVVFIFSILLDKIRMLLWRPFKKKAR